MQWGNAEWPRQEDLIRNVYPLLKKVSVWVPDYALSTLVAYILYIPDKCHTTWFRFLLDEIRSDPENRWLHNLWPVFFIQVHFFQKIQNGNLHPSRLFPHLTCGYLFPSWNITQAQSRMSPFNKTIAHSFHYRVVSFSSWQI